MMAATGDSLLTTFQKHIEDMRGLTLCKICLRPFYEPFTLACGHTYCYSCLRDWLPGPGEQTADKGCPDCRQKIQTEPSPNYTLRDLVHMFVNRVELLPEDESVEEHERGKRAEAKVLADDRKCGGVFGGRFERRRLSLFGFDHRFHDAADGVDRYDLDSADDLAELHAINGVPAGYIGPRNYGYFDGTDHDHTDTYDAYASNSHDYTDTGLSTDNNSSGDDGQGPFPRMVSVPITRGRPDQTALWQEDEGSESETATPATNYDNDTDATPRRTSIRAHNSFSQYLSPRVANRSSPPTRQTALPPGNWARRAGVSMGAFRRRPESGAGTGVGRSHPYARVR
ncbi:hypothetical protein DV736_g4997, partial [Chaetothyriales sp. CBS 134916]